jgi:hypothetical protein
LILVPPTPWCLVDKAVETRRDEIQIHGHIRNLLTGKISRDEVGDGFEVVLPNTRPRKAQFANR